MSAEKGVLLIVDDEPYIVEALSKIMEKYVDKILTASNGLEAQAILNTSKVHCILCDIKMPLMDGISLLKEIRDAGNNVPFIFITAYASVSDVFKGVNLGAVDFIFKSNLDGVHKIIIYNLKRGLNIIEGSERPETAEEITDYNIRWEELKKKMK